MIKTHSCVTLTCDVCGEEFTYDGILMHYPDLAEAASNAEGDDWFVTASGYAVCDNAREADHEKALNGLLGTLTGRELKDLRDYLGLDDEDGATAVEPAAATEA